MLTIGNKITLFNLYYSYRNAARLIIDSYVDNEDNDPEFVDSFLLQVICTDSESESDEKVSKMMST